MQVNSCRPSGSKIKTNQFSLIVLYWAEKWTKDQKESALFFLAPGLFFTQRTTIGENCLIW
jgi:hypothetical protein